MTSHFPLYGDEIRMEEQKPAIRQKQMALLEERYDLANRPSADHKMDRTKPCCRRAFA